MQLLILREHSAPNSSNAVRSPSTAVPEIGHSLASALAHLHANKLVHRDVKPSNVIFVGGVAKLADIGLVAGVDDARSFVGTEGYIPPEGSGTPSADCYSLGKLLYELSTGHDRNAWPEPPADLATRPDRERLLELNAILHRACAPEQRERYQAADAMRADLELLNAGRSVKRRRSVQRGWAWTWKVAALLALLSLGALLIRNERDRRAALTRLNASPFEKSGTTNLAAWKARERGGTMSATFAATGFSNAIQELERAVALDPNYAGAWTQLAMALCLSVERGLIPGGEALQRARLCAEKAVKLDPANGWSLSWLGECRLALDYDFGHAEPLLRRAVRLAPGNSVLRHNLARLLWFYGRFEEAESIVNQVIREPLPRSLECLVRLDLRFPSPFRGRPKLLRRVHPVGTELAGIPL